MTTYDNNVAAFFASFVVPGADNRMLIGYDSMNDDFGGQERSIGARAIIESWDIPNLPDGSPGWVGYATCAGSCNLSRMMIHQVAATSPAGWNNRTGGISGQHRPGGTQANGVSGGTYTVGGAMSGGEFGRVPQPATDWEIASGTTRTPFTADYSTNGLCLAVWAQMFSQFLSFSPKGTGFGCCRDPFAELQSRARLIYAKAAGSPTDMLMRGYRQSHAELNLNTNSSLLKGSGYTTVNFNGTGTGYTDVDCGASAGAPGLLLYNPDAATVAAGPATEQNLYITGKRIFRDSGGVPLAGTSIAMLAAGSFCVQQHASCLGVAGQLGGFTSPADGPDPYCDATETRDYLSAMCGRTTGSNYPNKIIIYTGHNLSGQEQAELSSGISATMISALNAIFDQHDANAAAAGSEPPDYLLISCEKFFTGFSTTQVANKLATLRAYAATGRARVSFIDLYPYTDDGTPLGTIAWYSVAGALPSNIGSGGGPLTNALDVVHNSYPGNRFIWRMVFEIGMRALGRDVGVTGGGTRPYAARAGSGRFGRF